MRAVGDIVRQRREALGLSLAALAEAAGVTKGYLSQVENHRVARPPSRRVLEALEGALGISGGELTRAAAWAVTPEPVRQEIAQLARDAHRGQKLAAWLRTQTDRRHGGGKNLDKLYRSGQLRRQIDAALREADAGDAGGGETGAAPGGDPSGGASGSGGAEPDAVPVRMPIRYRVPLINRVAAGYPSDFTDLGYPARAADEYVDCPDLTDPDAFAARVVGDSMTPEYRAGDIVVFSPAAAVSDGCDCFVRIDDRHETTFKRVYFEDGGAAIRLQPLNPAFAPATYARERVAGLYRAVWRFSKLA